MKKCLMGIDIGGTKCMFVLFDRDMNVIKRVKHKTRADQGRKRFMQALTEAITKLLETVKKKHLELIAVGVGCAGRINSNGGSIELCPNIKFLEGYPLANRISKLTDVPVHIANDVRAGLYAEFKLGAARGAQHVIGVFIGTGIGGALIIDGEPYTGSSNAAGDIGNYLLHAMGPQSAMREEEVLDDVASRSAIAGDAAKLAAKQSARIPLKEMGTDVTKIRSGHLAKAVGKGDKAVIELIQNRAFIIGVALSNLIDFINPDVVVLGGGLVEALPALIKKSIEKSVREHTAPAALEKLKIKVTHFKEYAVAAGGAQLALDALQQKTKRLRKHA